MHLIKEIVKNTLLEIRDFFWNYPYFFIDHSILIEKSLIWRWFMLSRPLSIIIVFGMAFLSLFLLSSSALAGINNNNSTIIEAVVKSPDFDGKLLVNPILNSSEQINKNLNKLIYEPLFLVKPNGDIEPNLAEKYEFEEGGKVLKISLRKDVYFHNGDKLTSDDVSETLRRLKNLPSSTNSASSILDTAEIEIVDDYTLKIRKNVVLASIIESINIGILPKKELIKYNFNRLELYPINKNPIGTGPYIFQAGSKDRVVLIANDKYWKGKPKVKQYVLQLFKTEREAVIALKSGQVHLFNNLTATFNEDIATNSNLKVIKTDPLYRKYWAIYFNLSDKESVFSDISFRQAVSNAINKDKIVSNLNNLAIPAHITIPPISWVNITTVDNFDPTNANLLLNKTGYLKPELEKFRQKEGKILEFQLSYSNTKDKQVLAESIKEDLEDVGISVKLDPQNINLINETTIPSKNFEALIYGVETLNDPDRIGFWHEDAINYPGLNYSSYISNIKIKDPITGERKSRVNDSLEKGISSLDRNVRKDQYESLIKILHNEMPAVLLYYPIYQVVYNLRLNGIETKDISQIEDIYRYSYLWTLTY